MVTHRGPHHNPAHTRAEREDVDERAAGSGTIAGARARRPGSEMGEKVSHIRSHRNGGAHSAHTEEQTKGGDVMGALISPANF